MRSRVGTIQEYSETASRQFWCPVCERSREDKEAASAGRIANAAMKLLDVVERTMASWSAEESLVVHEMRMAAHDLRETIEKEMRE